MLFLFMERKDFLRENQSDLKEKFGFHEHDSWCLLDGFFLSWFKFLSVFKGRESNCYII